MQKVTNSKFFVVGAITVAMVLIFVPLVAMHVFTTFSWWYILIAYAMFTAPAMGGLAILFNIWPMFEMKKRDTPKQ